MINNTQIWKAYVKENTNSAYKIIIILKLTMHYLNDILFNNTGNWLLWYSMLIHYISRKDVITLRIVTCFQLILFNTLLSNYLISINWFICFAKATSNHVALRIMHSARDFMRLLLLNFWKINVRNIYKWIRVSSFSIFLL